MGYTRYNVDCYDDGGTIGSQNRFGHRLGGGLLLFMGTNFQNEAKVCIQFFSCLVQDSKHLLFLIIKEYPAHRSSISNPLAIYSDTLYTPFCQALVYTQNPRLILCEVLRSTASG